MFDYLEKFNALPQDLRAKISSPAVMSALAALESKYGVDLAMTVMRVMIKTLGLESLPLYFASEFGLSQTQSESLARDLKDQVFLVVATYLGLNPDAAALDLNQNLNLIIKDSGVNFTSQDSLNRFRKILDTYLRGIRTRIDTRNSLTKGVVAGGLSLDTFTIDKIFKACDRLLQKLPAPEIVKPPVSPALEKLIVTEAKPVITHESEYNLKDLAAKGQLRPLKALDTSHELEAPDPVLDLPQGETVIPKIPSTPVVFAVPAAPLASKSVPTPSENIPASVPTPPAKAPVLPLSENAPIAPPLRPAIIPKPLAPKPPLSSAAALRPAVEPNRPRVADIKPMPKIMGPVEELQFLDLVNFRRLGQNPTEIMAKVYNKIRLLEKTGYDQMITGVVAWRKGIINRLYLKMGQEAFTRGLPLKEIIAKRQSEGREYLNLEEIQAIIELNKKLMF